jgi:hypothetical protein
MSLMVVEAINLKQLLVDPNSTSSVGMRVRHRQVLTYGVTSSLESYLCLFSAYFRYSCAGGNFISSARLPMQDVHTLDFNANRVGE